MHLFSYWAGPLGWMERLSVASIRDVGHSLTVYSHQPAALAGMGCAVQDAREIFHGRTAAGLKGYLPQTYSNLFRLEGIAVGAGTWIDLDMVLLKPLPTAPYLFSWEGETAVCNSVLSLPTKSAVLTEYRGMLHSDPAMLSAPSRSWHQKVNRRIKAISRPLRGKAAPLPDSGPLLLTYLLGKHGLLPHAQPRSVFYPVPPVEQVMSRLHVPGVLESFLAPDTVGIHLWRHLYRKLNGPGQPRAGWLANRLEQMCAVA